MTKLLLGEFEAALSDRSQQNLLRSTTVSFFTHADKLLVLITGFTTASATAAILFLRRFALISSPFTHSRRD